MYARTLHGTCLTQGVIMIMKVLVKIFRTEKLLA